MGNDSENAFTSNTLLMPLLPEEETLEPGVKNDMSLFAATPSNDNDDTPSKKSTVVDWPIDSANQLLFHMPKHWNDHGMNSQFVKLQWDIESRYINIVDSSDPMHIVDRIDIDDMIGCNVEISTTSNSMTDHSRYEVILNRATNEPQTDIASDTIGYATLQLYVYPRKDLRKKYHQNWVQWLLSIFQSFVTVMTCCCGDDNNLSTTTNDNPPQPNYQRPAESTTVGPYPQYGNRYAHHRSLKLVPMEDLYHVNRVVTALKQLLSSQNKRLKYLVLVNPRSGPKKNGVSMYENVVKEMLDQANIDTDLVITTHPKHAMEVCMNTDTTTMMTGNTIDIGQYDALILMGGDGIMHEVINGIEKRADKEVIYQNVKLGIIGCGTANGMASSIAFASNERYGIMNETFLVVKGKTSRIDLSKYEILTKSWSTSLRGGNDPSNASSSSLVISYMSCLTYTWALISDIDLESEALHWLGPTRFDIWAVYRVLFLRRYKAKLSYKPATSGFVNLSSSSPDPINNPNHITEQHPIPVVTEPIPSDWKTIDDDIVLIWVSHVTHAGMFVYHSPPSKLNDGIFQIMLIRGKNLSRLRITMIMLGLETGSHVGMNGCEFIECSAFRLVPYEGQRISKNDIDGEPVEDGPIQAYVMPSALQVFGNLHDG